MSLTTISLFHIFSPSSWIAWYLYIYCGASVQTSGTTVTFVIIEGWVVTVASVGDSRGILESAEGGIYYLSADHRLDCNEEE
jgi:serine/threonine protein phosphatase PrpC